LEVNTIRKKAYFQPAFLITYLVIIFLISKCDDIGAFASTKFLDPGDKIDTFYMNGMITNFPSSSSNNTLKSSTIENSSAIGNWTLLVENGTPKQFNATLTRYFEGPSTGVLNIGGFSTTAHKHIQLGTPGSHIISGIIDILRNGKLIQDNIGVTVIISNLNQINIILDSPKAGFKNPIVGQIKSVKDENGNNIGVNITNDESQINSDISSNSDQSIRAGNNLDQNIVSGYDHKSSGGSLGQQDGGSDVGDGGSDVGDGGSDVGDGGSDEENGD
jgi:hypothetical protein